MPYPRSSAGYPASIRSLLEEVAADNLGRRVPFASPKQAFGQRSRVYAYIAAIKRDLTHRPAWLGEAEAADLRDFLQRAMTLELVVSGNDLIVRPRDESPMADAFRKATLVDAAPAPESEAKAADSSLARLLEKTHAKP